MPKRGSLHVFVFYEMSTPEVPRKLPYEILGLRASAVAIARQNNGKYLLIMKQGGKLFFYQSTNSNLENARFDEKPVVWTSDELNKGNSDGEWNNYQNINLFQPCTGDHLYLVGFGFKKADEVALPFNKFKVTSWADLFRVSYSRNRRKSCDYQARY